MRVLIVLLLSSIVCFGQNKPSDANQTANEAVFTEAMAAFLTEDYSNALNQFEVFLKIDNNSAVGFYMKSRIERELGMNIQSESSAEKAVEIEGNQPYYLAQYADILTVNNKAKLATNIYKKIIKLNPESKENYLKLAELQNADNQFSDALKTYGLIETQFGISNETSLAKQEILLKTNKFSVDKNNNIATDNPELLISQVDLLIENNQIKQAIKVLEDADDTFEKGIEKLGQLYVATHSTKELNRLVNKVIESDNYSEHLKIIMVGFVLEEGSEVSGSRAQELTDLLSGFVGVNNHDAQGYKYLGNLYLLQNNKVKAADCYAKSLKKDKNQFELWLDLAGFNFKLADFTGLEKTADEASIYFPNHGEIWYYLAFAQLMNGNLDDAEISIEQLEFLKPSGEMSDNLTALKLAYENQTQKPSASLNFPENETGLFFKSVSQMDNNPKNSVQILTRLDTENKESNIYKIFMALANIKANEVNKAEEIIKEIDEGELVKSAIGLEIKGDIMESSGNLLKAKELWTQALKLNPENKALRLKLK